jgi:hypothetical protein
MTFQPVHDDLYTKIPGYAFHVADSGCADRAKNLAAAQEFLEKPRTALGIARILAPNVLSLTY